MADSSVCLQSLQISLTQIGSRGSLTRRMRSLKSCLCEEERNTVTLFMLNRRTLFFAVIKGSRLTCQTDRPNGQEVKPLVTPEASLQRVSSSKKSHASKKNNPQLLVSTARTPAFCFSLSLWPVWTLEDRGCRERHRRE